MNSSVSRTKASYLTSLYCVPDSQLQLLYAMPRPMILCFRPSVPSIMQRSVVMQVCSLNGEGSLDTNSVQEISIAALKGAALLYL